VESIAKPGHHSDAAFDLKKDGSERKKEKGRRKSKKEAWSFWEKRHKRQSRDG